MSKPEKIVTDAIYAAVGSPEYVAWIIVEDLRAAGYPTSPRRKATPVSSGDPTLCPCGCRQSVCAATYPEPYDDRVPCRDCSTPTVSWLVYRANDGKYVLCGACAARRTVDP